MRDLGAVSAEAVRPPGLRVRRLERLVREAVARTALDLSGLRVVTEAATGAYAVTPVLAALAGAADVLAITRASRYGSVEDVRSQTFELAESLGVADRITITEDRDLNVFRSADIVTNSGFVRPIDRAVATVMRPGAAVPLMYEAWEHRDSDVDLAACRDAGVVVGATNEQHPIVGVFGFLGAMAARQLTDAAISPPGARVLLLCSNPFMPYLRDGLTAAGAHVDVIRTLDEEIPESTDVVLVAEMPGCEPTVGPREASVISRRIPNAIIVQFFGDIDRAALDSFGLSYWPYGEPPSGHMGILPSAIGPESIVRLQAGGLKVGELLVRGPSLDASLNDIMQSVN